MKKLILLLSGLALLSNLFSQNELDNNPSNSKYPTGLTFDQNKYGSIPRKNTNFKSLFGAPASVDYSAYTPSVGNQGRYGTCVGFATAYAMRTMLKAMELESKNKNDININRFSPTYIYEYIKKPSDSYCQIGASFEDALDIMKTKGVPLLSDYSYPQCDSDESNYDDDAKEGKIADFSSLFPWGASKNEIVTSIKNALSEGYPVVFGMRVPESFMLIKNDLWVPNNTDLAKKNGLGGHAMAIIGYDDSKYGGAFHILNSWGTGWADNGFTWAKYEDIGNFTMCAYQVYPKLKPNPKPDEVILKASVAFNLSGGTDMPFEKITKVNKAINRFNERYKNLDNEVDIEKSTAAYKATQSYPSNTRFKFKITNSKQGFIYAFSSDLSGKVNKIFPFTDSDSPIIGPNIEITYPGESRSIKMDETTGTDYLAILFSYEQLDTDKLYQAISASQGDFYSKIMNALGPKMIASNEINYLQNQVGFECKGNHDGSVVPLIVEIGHK